MNLSEDSVRNAPPRLRVALHDYLTRTRRGETVDRAAFLSRYPEIAGELQIYLGPQESQTAPTAETEGEASEISISQVIGETAGSSPPANPSQLPEVFGRYRVERQLGRGAMGAVYLAEDTQLARRVALKVPSFNGGQTPDILVRFYQEARSAALLRNPHICPIYDVGEINGQHYISMAYIDGQPLSDVIKVRGPQAERPVLLLIRKLALAMFDAHQQGIVHRDLKPANVMIDARGEPVIMDFGLACQTQDGAERLTQSGMILGSPAYMAPEQLDGGSNHVTPAADQYALGVMFYELLTGTLPFRGTVSAVLAQIITKTAPSPKRLRPELDSRVDELCLQMLAKSPDDRLPSMRAVADRLLEILKWPEKTPSPETPAPEVPAPSPPAASSVTWETQATSGQSANTVRQQVTELVKRKDLQGALDLLDTLTDQPDEKLADWARQRQLQIRQQLEKSDKNLATLCDVARRLLQKSDYSEARRILSEVPTGERSRELRELLREAEDKEDECDLLLQDIKQAIRKNEPHELPIFVKRYLQLKPGNKSVQELADDLKRYGAERVIHIHRGRRKFLDAAGQVWNPWYAVLYIGGLTAACTALYFANLAYQDPSGMVIVDVHDPRITVQFADADVTAANSGRQFRLKTTERKLLEVAIDGEPVAFTAPVEVGVGRNETKRIVARLVDGKLNLDIAGVQAEVAIAGENSQTAPRINMVGSADSIKPAASLATDEADVPEPAEAQPGQEVFTLRGHSLLLNSF